MLLTLAALSCAGQAAPEKQSSAGTVQSTVQPTARPPQEVPRDDPYLPTTAFLSQQIRPDPIHNLDTVRTTWWGNLPPRLVEQVVGDSPGQRVIFQDTLTGAEVWLICRSPGDEFEGFYSTLGNFNADGSMLEIDRYLLSTDGAKPRSLNDQVSRKIDRSPVRDFHWSDTDPNVGLSQRFSGAIYRYNVKTGHEALVFDPGKTFPSDCSVLITNDGKYKLVSRQKNNRDPFLYLADGKGRVIRQIELKTRSKNPAKDHMGALHVYQDQDGEYFFLYSLNKSAALTSNPHQQWMAALDGSVYVDGAELEGSLSEGYLIGGKRRLLTPAASDPMTSTLGHAGMSPSERYSVESDGVFIQLTDLQTRQMSNLSYVPSADHFDWSAKVDGFLHRTRSQVGLPIYRVDVPSGIAQRIVATNTSDHLSCFSYSHPSPDGTKCLYRSSMLGNLDMYLAVIRYPAPPRNVMLTRQAKGVHLKWQDPEPAREIKGYRVYRGKQSGGPYTPVSDQLMGGNEYIDPTTPTQAYYVLTSVEHSGLESQVFSNETATDWEGGSVNYYIEAETGNLAFPMREVFVPPTASAAYSITRAVRDPLWQPVAGEAAAKWNIYLPKAGSYTLWARIRVRLENKADLSFSIGDESFGTHEAVGSEWHWARLAEAKPLKPGSHLLRCIMSRPGCELDKLVLTSDPGLVPKAKGNLPAQAPDVPSSIQAAQDETGDHVVLHWEHLPSALLHHFNVYRGTSPEFDAGQHTLLGSPTRNQFLDPYPAGTGTLFYKVSAIDTWGNESQTSAVASLDHSNVTQPVHFRVDLDQSHAQGGLPLSQDPEASGGQCMVLDGAVKKGALKIPLTVPPGRYLVWVRAKSEGRYQTAQLEIGSTGRAEKCQVTGVGKKLFTESMWSWHRVQSLSSSDVPRRAPLWIKVTADHPTLSIAHLNGYMALDEIYLTTSVHDLPDPDAIHFKPVDEFRFPLRR